MSQTDKQDQSSNLKFFIGGGLIVAALIAAFIFLQQKPVVAEQNEPTENAEKIAELPENILGKQDALVTIIEYSSMTCPHCAVFHADTLPGLKEKYINTGKVKYILREFPLDRVAAAAFMLGRCLPKRETYFDFIDILYAQQKSWAQAEGGPIEPLKKLSLQAGFTEKSFNACLDDKTLFAQIITIKNNGSKQHEIRSTPTFFINDTRLEGALPLEQFAKVIDPLLKK